MADAMSAGAREDVVPATDNYDLCIDDLDDSAEPFAGDPYRQISILEIAIVFAIAGIMWTAIFAAVLW